MDNYEIGNIHPYHDVPREGFFKWSVMNVLVLPTLFLLKLGLWGFFIVSGVSFFTHIFLHSGYDEKIEDNNLARCEQNMASMAQGLEDYHKAHGQYPQNQYQLVPDYIGTIPICPASERAGYRTDFALSKDDAQGRQSYTITCAESQHHPIATPTRPQLTGPK